jgi:hypothetical protein
MPGVRQAQLVALEYPRGRRFMCTVKTARALGPGAEFDLFGRAWRVSHVERPASRRSSGRPYLVAVDAGGGPKSEAPGPGYTSPDLTD